MRLYYEPEAVEEPGQFPDQADRRLYRKKRRGRLQRGYRQHPLQDLPFHHGRAENIRGHRAPGPRQDHLPEKEHPRGLARMGDPVPQVHRRAAGQARQALGLGQD